MRQNQARKKQDSLEVCLKAFQNILSYPDWRRQKVKALHFNRRCLNHERFLTSRKLADARRTVAHI